MSNDSRIFIIGEDVHTLHVNLYAKFGKERVIRTPISESAFLGAGVTAAMAGLRPIVEIMFVDLFGVAMDQILNNAAKVFEFSGKKWNVPLVIKASCGGGYGDGGQHEQSLWGWLAHIPGVSVVVPSNPADAGGLLLSAIEMDHPVIYLEHKLLSEIWLDYMGRGGRTTVAFDVPNDGYKGEIPDKWNSLPVGKARILHEGSDVSLISLGVSVHRCVQAAELLLREGISAEVIDLRWVSPLDEELVAKSILKTKGVVVVDEDYKQFGLSGEICAILAEQDISFKFRRICTETTIPYNRDLEDQILPNVDKIIEAVRQIIPKR
ncbi:alpha-ketoacid dehydrogenase subunit beta [Candidatus Hodarchaeum mangrovi]